ncbi:uncharacterized protein LOC112349549 [Selaginella moellendorffii]|uniref:uncharacterized protein LOC112349549 n=1 Tax=Selaginella moellendorffii TaxID=88036 RepID=UPI000D1C6FF6|nr:uncharacterized protein LOC112349549 [Selaginella moellendorffii]|eukprot:XP_024539906.1 uncharacterized protein LOC112349549 [Selaginella moellendorffii]
MAAIVLMIAFLVMAAAWKMVCIRKREERARFLASLHPVRDAHKILWYMYSVEFPFLSQKALEFGTIRTLGIPGITNLLFKTKYGLKDPQKRAADTNILVSEMIHHHVDSDRGSYAVRRLNGIHNKFKIPNDQFAYVLCLNVVSPIDFSERFGFRKWTDNEKEAAYVVWHDVGVRMGITTIPDSIPEMREYIRDYEAKNAILTDKNKSIVQDLKHLVLDAFPRPVQPLVETGICALIDPTIRSAVGLEKPPAIVEWIILGAFKLLAGSFVSAFLPPRRVEDAKGSIEVDWCPNPAANPEEYRQLNVNVYRPPAFEKGYKLAELGALKSGKLGPYYDGGLRCPFRQMHA